MFLIYVPMWEYEAKCIYKCTSLWQDFSYDYLIHTALLKKKL